jgi:hypothetical protein
VIGVDTPALLLPPLGTLTQHLGVAGSVSWVDDAGWHFRAVSPFPGSVTLASETAGLMDVQSSALAAGFLLPALAKSRVAAMQTQDLANSRQICLGLVMYASDHKGRLPEKLSETRPYVDNNVRLFAGAPGKQAAPAGGGNEAARWVDEQGDYTYVLGGRKLSEIQAAGETVMIYRKHAPGEARVVVGFADGHCEVMPAADLGRKLEAQHSKTVN